MTCVVCAKSLAGAIGPGAVVLLTKRNAAGELLEANLTHPGCAFRIATAESEMQPLPDGAPPTSETFERMIRGERWANQPRPPAPARPRQRPS